MEWLERVSKTLGGLVHFAPYLSYNAKYTTPLEFLKLPQVIPTSIPNLSDLFDVVQPLKAENKWPVAISSRGLQDVNRCQ